LFVALEAGFDATSPLVIGGHIGQQDGDGISGLAMQAIPAS
jgi:hypothetical protein